MPRGDDYITRTGGSYIGTIGPTANKPPITTPGLADIIKGLTTPGLVPDIARQSAEVSAGRGIPGSPAAASTAVRMSEQDYLQRLGLANTLLTGEADRNLPYNITPYQQAWLDLYRMMHTTPGKITYGGGLGGGGGGGGGSVPRGTGGSTPWAGFTGGPVIDPVTGTRPSDSVANWSPNPRGNDWITGSRTLPLYPGGPVVSGLDDMKQSLFGEEREDFDPITGLPWSEGLGIGDGGLIGDGLGD